MNTTDLWRFLPVGYLFTVALETPVLWLLLSPRHPRRRRLFAGLWLTGNLKSAGAHTLSASFGGTTGFLPSTSATYTQTIGKIATNSVVVASVSRSNFSRPVTFTATVTGTTGTPTGTVTFYDGVNVLGSIGLSAGSAAYTTSALAVGSHSITV